MAIKIAVYNAKGGVGKTTSCKAIAGSLSQRGYRVLIIDSDPSSNASTGLARKNPGEEPEMYFAEYIIRNVEDEMETDPRITVCETAFDNLDIIPSTKTLMLKADRVMANALFPTDNLFKILLQDLEEDYDFFIYDLVASDGGKLTTNALMYSDYVIVPFQPSIDSIFGYKDVKDKIHLIHRAGGNIKILGGFMTMYDSRTAMSKDMLDAANQFLGDELFPVYIRMSSDVEKSRNAEKPLIYYKKSAKPTMDYEILVDAILKRIQKIEEE